MTLSRILLGVLVLASACTSASQTSDDPTPTQASPSPTLAEGEPLPVARGEFARLACNNLPPEQLHKVWTGYHPGRGGELQFVPKFPNVLGSWFPHSGPWPYLQRVPVFLYGPGHVAEVGRVETPATVADLAPTFGELLGFPFDAPDGRVLREAVAEDRQRPPKLILTVVWDGGGRNVLSAYPNRWPVVQSLIPGGAWYEEATVGSSPSVTPAIHTTIGTGAFPRAHGILDLRFQVDGELVPPVTQGPQWYLTPTLGDVYDAAMGNEPLVGMIATEAALGMIGHGSDWEGGDRDIALAQRGGVWSLKGPNEEIFEFPGYADEAGDLEGAVAELDAADGQRDDAWMGEPMFDDPDDLTHTPAYSVYNTDVIAEVIRREGFGADDVPDLLYVNYKQIDKVGHRWSFPSPFMEQVVESHDTAFGDLVDLLDDQVGEGEWVIALTADHGATPQPDTTGAFVIDNKRLVDDLLAEFDDDDGARVLQNLRVTQGWFDEDELEQNGHTIEDVARWFMAYTKGDNAADPSALTEEERNETVFSAAFPASILDGTLRCIRDLTG